MVPRALHTKKLISRLNSCSKSCLSHRFPSKGRRNTTSAQGILPLLYPVHEVWLWHEHVESHTWILHHTQVYQAARIVPEISMLSITELSSKHSYFYIFSFLIWKSEGVLGLVSSHYLAMLAVKTCMQAAIQNSLYPLHCLHLVCLILIIITPGIPAL